MCSIISSSTRASSCALIKKIMELLAGRCVHVGTIWIYTLSQIDVSEIYHIPNFVVISSKEAGITLLYDRCLGN